MVKPFKHGLLVVSRFGSAHAVAVSAVSIPAHVHSAENHLPVKVGASALGGSVAAIGAGLNAANCQNRFGSALAVAVSAVSIPAHVLGAEHHLPVKVGASAPGGSVAAIGAGLNVANCQVEQVASLDGGGDSSDGGGHKSELHL